MPDRIAGPRCHLPPGCPVPGLPGGSLRFTVTDNGTGFGTTTTPPGTGPQGMTDRLAALGGTLHIRSQPGQGTTLSGGLPVSALG
jgi:two-component system, NarL family, sensor histidine kinase DesK